MVIEENIKYGIGENDFLDIYYPDSEEYDVLIWFHGGGLEGGSRKDIRFAEDLTRAGMAVVSVEYRMYPKVVFPDFIEDCARAVKYVADHIANKEDAKRVFISGQSAGAYITMMLAMNKRYLEDVNVDRTQIAAFISESAQMTVHFNVLRERGLDTRLERIDEAAPMNYLSEHCFEGNLLIIYYDNDLYCRPEENCLFYKSITRFCPGQRIEIRELSGAHCNGSYNKNEKGTYDFNDVLLEFLYGNEKGAVG